MATIQSSVGLYTGIDIADTVAKLIALSAKSRDLITARNKQLEKQQTAITELTALLIGVQYAARNLATESAFTKLAASTSDEALLSAAVTGQPPAGTYQYTPIRRAQAQHLLSTGVEDLDAPLGEGALSLRFGGFVNEGRDLDELNAGQGVGQGKIRITDRSGAAAVVNLRFVRTVDDVLAAINAREAISVRAVAEGDAIRLIDGTGQSISNLRVQEVGLGSTAADLGLAGINVAADTAMGQDVVQLYEGLSLSQLNDGNGVSLRDGLPDLEVSFRDGSSALQIDLEFAGDEAPTLGDLLQAINEADPARLSARISSDGERVELVDLTTPGGGELAVSSPLGGSAAEDLGLTGSSVEGVLASHRLQAGLQSSLLSSLDGGKGLGELGLLDVTDRSGASSSVDLSSAETLDDVVAAINHAGVGVTARINDARSGILLADTTGSTSNHLVVSSGDAANSAEKLNLAVDAAVTSVDSGSLHLQVYSEQMRLDDLNQGRGVAKGSFLIVDSNGARGGINLSLSGIETVGGLLDAINALDIGVEARINDAGDGLLLVDTAQGAGELRIEPSGNGATVADLNLDGEAVVMEVDGESTQVIDGSTTFRIEIAEGESLSDLIDKINSLGTDVAAVAFNNGAETAPYRLSLVSQLSGKAGELLVEATGLSLTFQEITPAQDALLAVGSMSATGGGVLASSSSNTFDNLLDGLSLTVQGTSLDPVTVTVERSDESLITNMKTFVTQFNKLRDKLDKLTYYDETENATGILFGTNEVLRIETSLSYLLSGRFFGAGSMQSLEEAGLSLEQDGQLEFDAEAFKDCFAEDPDALQEFFTTEDLGVAAKLDAIIETLVGEDNSLLINRRRR